MFFVLFSKIIPLYLFICIGFSAAKLLKMSGDEMAKFTFFFLAPMVYFKNSTQIQINEQIFSLPFVVFLMCSLMSNSVYHASRFLYKGNVRNILAFSSGGPSTGFFGLPVAASLFDKRTMSFYIIGSIGAVIFENSYGYYLVARCVYSRKECIIKTFKSPSMWGTICGIAAAAIHVQLPDFANSLFSSAEQTFSLIGMSLLGISISKIKIIKFDAKFIATICFTKYILWPASILGLIYFDKHVTGFYNEDIYRALTLFSVIPASASSIIFASVFNNNSDTVAIMLLINTTIGLFYVPLMISFLMY